MNRASQSGQSIVLWELGFDAQTYIIEGEEYEFSETAAFFNDNLYPATWSTFCGRISMKPSNALKRIIPAVMFVLLAGCGTTNVAGDNKAVEEHFKEQALGKNIDDLLSQWGPAQNATQLPGFGGKVYVWKFGDCENVVTTDQYGVISEYSARGTCILQK